MANPNNIGKELDKRPAQRSLQDLINDSTKELRRVLPKQLDADRFARIALTAIRTNPELAKCTPESFLGALFTAAQVGVEPVGGRAYLLPFNNKRKIDGKEIWIKEVQYVIGYPGIADLFYRHEKAIELIGEAVHKNDSFDYELGTDGYLKHRPALVDRGEVVAHYVVAKLQGGGRPFKVMSKSECIEHGKKHSKSFDKEKGQFKANTPWLTDEDAMCLKTVFLQLSKLLPLSVEAARLIQADETSRPYKKGFNPLDIPDQTTWDAEGEVVDATPTEPGPAPETPTEPQESIKDKIRAELNTLLNVHGVDPDDAIKACSEFPGDNGPVFFTLEQFEKMDETDPKKKKWLGKTLDKLRAELKELGG